MSELNGTALGVLIAGVFGLFIFLATVVLSITWFERKFLARIQMRAGPSRVGPHGLLQPIADVLKIFSKEDVSPAQSSKVLFWAAPLLTVVPAIMLWITIPFAEGAVVHALDLGLLYIIAVSTLGVIGLLLAGYTSASKYSVLGGIRAAAQLVSYEIPIIVVVLSIGVLVQSLDLQDVISGTQVVVGERLVTFQGQGAVPFAVIMPLGVFIFFLAGLAEIGRTPFDIHHAESEVVGGPFVEYSGAHWAAFFLAEYINTFLIGALTVLLFFGGWSWPSPPESLFGSGIPNWATNALGIAWFMFKTYLVIGVIFWFRGTYPRLRIDQLMAFGWQVLIPLAFLNLVLTAVVIFYGWPLWSLTLLSLPFLGGTLWVTTLKKADPKKTTTVSMYRRVARPDGGYALVSSEAPRGSRQAPQEAPAEASGT